MTNKAFFQTYSKTTDIEKLLLGAAQKLRLFLIYYLYGSNNVKQVSRKWWFYKKLCLRILCSDIIKLKVILMMRNGDCITVAIPHSFLQFQ